MDWKIFMGTFTTIFIAELGDKTQLAAITAVSQSRKPLPVFLGASAALVLVTLIGVLFGAGLTRLVPEAVLKKIAGGLFILIGALVLMEKI